MYWRYLIATFFLIAVLSGLFTGLTRMFGTVPAGQSALIGYSSVVSLAAAATGMAPLALALPHGDQARCALACLAGGVLRLLLTLAATYLVYLFLVDRSLSTWFYLWSAAYYLCILAWETTAFLLIIRKESSRWKYAMEKRTSEC